MAMAEVGRHPALLDGALQQSSQELAAEYAELHRRLALLESFYGGDEDAQPSSEPGTVLGKRTRLGDEPASDEATREEGAQPLSGGGGVGSPSMDAHYTPPPPPAALDAADPTPPAAASPAA